MKTPLFAGRRWLTAALVVYACVLLFRLDQVPLTNPDEAAYTEPAWTLLTQRQFGAPMYAGMFAIDQRWYFLWPGYAVLAAVPYALLGPSVVGVRLLSGVFGGVTLAALWYLAAMLSPRKDLPGQARVAIGAVALAAVHPTLFFLSRFGRPEIAVTAFAVLSSALAAHASGAPGRRRWHAAAGAAAGLSFLMHQYGAFAVAALAASYLLRRPAGLREHLAAAAWAGAGLAVTLLPWLVWVLLDAREFWTQFAAQLAYQRWRYPAATLTQNVATEAVARYVLGAQDYPSGWRPWQMALATLLGSAVAGPLPTTPRGLVRLVAGVAVTVAGTSPAILARWAALAAAAVTPVASAAAARTFPSASPLVRWAALPMVVWMAGLALIPNKWDGYTGPVAAYTVVLLGALPWALQSSRWRLMAAGGALACGALWAASDAGALLHPRTPYAAYGAKIRALVPPGEPVASSMREWFAFAGRNPAVTYEFRAVPAFRTSVLDMIRAQRPRYLALHRATGAPGGSGGADGTGQRYHFIDAATAAPLYAYLDRSTTLVGEVSDPWFGTVEVRKVVEWPP